MRVLFLCTGNSCRSQMAEGLLRELGGPDFEVLSAGTRPQGLNPGAVRAMGDIGIDISGQTSNSIDEYLAEPPDLVVTVCGNAHENCPTFPGATRIEHWPFEDPAEATGSDEEVALFFDKVRDEIRARIERFLSERTATHG